MKAKISIITLGVEDLDRALRFYRDGLGFSTHNYTEGEDIVFFNMEGSWLALYPKEQLDKEFPHTNPLQSPPGQVTLAHNEPSKEGVDAVIEEARRAGAKILKEPVDVFWGGYSGYFADLDGHVWEVAYNPFTDLT